MFELNRFCTYLSTSMRLKPYRIYFLYLQIAIMYMAVGSVVWNMTAEIKNVLIAKTMPEFNAWTAPFFHPTEAALTNYLISSFIMFLCFTYLYSKLTSRPYITISFLCRRASFRRRLVMLLAVLLIFPFTISSGHSLHLKTTASILMALFTFLSINSYSICHNALKPIFSTCSKAVESTITSYITNPEDILPTLRRAAIFTTILLLGLMGLEAFTLIRGPVHVINEFLPLPSMPHVNGEYIKIGDLTAALEPSLRRELTLNNTREYFYQLSNRGVFLHIGHILNPLNEYLGGKPLSEIYFQYGLGFSFVYKKTMELFGGLAVQNYYKCHIYYILYWVTYLFISVYLFRSSFFVLLSMLALASGFFMLGYDVFVIAPGINPLIHFFDLPLLFFLFRYFCNRKIHDLFIAFGVGVVGIFFNQQFGLLGMLAAVLTLAMFYLENTSGAKRLLLIALLPCAVIVPLVVSKIFFTVATDAVFGYFLKGYFSFSPDRRFVTVIIANAAISYSFLLWKKNDKSPLKYLLCFLFFYFQALLVYYYWSGISNHFWPLFPILGLQLLVMTKIIDQSAFISSRLLKTVFFTVILTASLFMTINAAKAYYRQKASYAKVFATHKVYSWDFDRAKILSTIDPAPLSDSLALLRQYSGPAAENKGIVILSVFDNILPLLVGQYSLMPFFEMQWFLITKKEVNDAVQRIKQLKPQYIFVGHEVEADQFVDPWRVIFDESVCKDERFAASGRLHELRNVFLKIESDYVPVNRGKLLTVYKLNRKDVPPEQ